jgi:hypothetical protein
VGGMVERGTLFGDQRAAQVSPQQVVVVTPTASPTAIPPSPAVAETQASPMPTQLEQ